MISFSCNILWLAKYLRKHSQLGVGTICQQPAQWVSHSVTVYRWRRNILLSLRELLAYCQVWIFLWSDKLITSVLSIIFVHILPASKTISWQSSPNILLDIFQNDSILLFQGGLENQSPLFFPTSSDVTVGENICLAFLVCSSIFFGWN